jgi:hypothetical protein
MDQVYRRTGIESSSGGPGGVTIRGGLESIVRSDKIGRFGTAGTFSSPRCRWIRFRTHCNGVKNRRHPHTIEVPLPCSCIVVWAAGGYQHSWLIQIAAFDRPRVVD